MDRGYIPRRVLMTADTVGGVFIYALRLGRMLRERGVDVHIATMGPKPKGGQRAALEAAGICLHESDYALEWMPNPWREVDKASEWLLALERAIDPDVVQLNGYCHGALEWSKPVIVAAHSCVLSWWRAVHKEPAPKEWDEYRQRVQNGIFAADLVIAPTQAMLSAIEEEYGRPKKAEVIYHAVDIGEYRPAEPRGSFILSAGRLWDEAKNIQALGAIAHRLKYPVLLAGNNEFHHAKQRLPKGLQSLGELPPEDLAFWMGRAPIYALPASYEPFGLSVLEAALSGCALVLGNIPSLRELWEDAAIFVEPKSHEELETALTGLIERPSLREDLAKRARERALSFQPKDMLTGHLRIYERLMRGYRSRSVRQDASP